MPNIFQGDVGTVLELTVYDENNIVINLVTATVKQIKLKSPPGLVTTKTASFTTDGTDGKIRYTTTSGDLSVAGAWQAQGYIELGSSTKFHTSPIGFSVLSIF